MTTTPMTVVETDTFLERVDTILTESERADLVAHLASNPEAGRVMPATGGARKVRWAIAWQRETWWRTNDLLLPRFGAIVLAGHLRKERESEPVGSR
jgi:hypothetical protein